MHLRKLSPFHKRIVLDVKQAGLVEPMMGSRRTTSVGDDPSRFSDAKGLEAATITRASGETRSVTHRRVKNNPLAAVGLPLQRRGAQPAAQGMHEHPHASENK